MSGAFVDIGRELESHTLGSKFVSLLKAAVKDEHIEIRTPCRELLLPIVKC